MFLQLVHIILFTSIFITNLNFTTCGCEKSFVVICDGLSHIQYDHKKRTWTELLIQQRNYGKDIPEYTLTNAQLTRDLSNLKWLIINEHLTAIERNAFTYLKNLQQLILYGNDIPTIKRSTFVAFRNLLKLGLENNNIQKMETNAFLSSKIEVVDLSYNKLQVLSTGVFNKKCQIRTLKVTHNRLRNIESNSLPKDLKTLFLDHNHLVSVPDELNNLQLEELAVSHNDIDYIEVSKLQSLAKLDLSFNKLTSLSHEFDNLSQLKYLDLSGNQLEKFTLTPQLVHNFKEPFFLLLAHNRLRNLNLEFVRKEVTVTLSGNPWSCKCMEKMERDIANNNITKTTCEELISGSGTNPYCIADDDQRCSEYRLSTSVMEAFEDGYQTSLCDIFSDIDIFVK